MTPHPLLLKLLLNSKNGINFARSTFHQALVELGATEDEVHTIMWELRTIYNINWTNYTIYFKNK